jgi:methylenetetrahydrofolate reductase (NADPH)
MNDVISESRATATDEAVPSRLRQLLSRGEFVLTAEMVPPATTSRRIVLERAQFLSGVVDAVNVTDGAGARVHVSALVAAGELVAAGVDPILQMTCRDRNRLGLQSDLLGAATLGICNLLILRGDDPTAGDQPDTKPVFDLEATDLIATARMIRDSGELPSGRKVDGPAPFFLGAADMPIDPPAGWKPDRLRAKVVAGAEFAQTQICMDPELARRYAAALADHGLGDFSLILGVVVPASARSARWMKEKLFGVVIPDSVIERMEGAADEKAEGQAICAEVIQQLADIPGIAGAHVMAPLNEASIPGAVEKSGILKSRGVV